MYFNNKKHFIFISTILHGIFFLLISMRLNFFTAHQTIGFPDTALLYSYVLTDQPQKNIISPMKQVTQVVQAKSIMKKTITSSKKAEIALKTTSAPHIQTSTAGAKQQGLPTEALIALLHQAIQKQQHYPENAQEMRREGRVTVKFVLYPNGTISNVELVKSSGTDILDHAALQAITAAVPFADVDHYIHSSQEYRIDVVFELS